MRSLRFRARAGLSGLLALTTTTVFLVACGQPATSSAPPPTRTADDLATVQAAAGIVRPTATPRPPTPTPTTMAAAEPTAAPLEPLGPIGSDAALVDALLAPEDLPTMWTYGADYVGPEGWSFCGADDIETRFAWNGFAEVNFSATTGEYLFQRITWLNDADTQPAMDYVRQSFTCESESADGLNWAFSESAIPTIGDDAFGRQFSITFDNTYYTPMEGNLVFMRRGPLIVMIYHVGFNVDPAMTEEIARQAMRRAEAADPNNTVIRHVEDRPATT